MDGVNETCHKIFAMLVDIAEKIFKVRGQRSRSCVNARVIHLDDVLSRLTCLVIVTF